MKEKIVNFIVSFTTFILLLGMVVLLCWGLITVINTSSIPSNNVSSSTSVEPLEGKVFVFTDPDTNLQYLIYKFNGGICPRYGADGKQMNGSVNNETKGH